MSRFHFLALAAASLSLAACEAGPPTTQQQQAARAEAAARSISFTDNAEIGNISRRVRMTANPGQIGYILLLNESGTPIVYASVRGKVTSGGRRLTPAHHLDCNSYGCGQIEQPGDEGTFGSSNPYIYFWTTEDQYYQWSGQYLYSDRPFRTTVTPFVVAVREGRAPAALQPATPPQPANPR